MELSDFEKFENFFASCRIGLDKSRISVFIDFVHDVDITFRKLDVSVFR
jgi:hypothetical protein